jgi:hypothetical protein
MDVLLAGYGLLHLEGDLRWIDIDMTAARLDLLAQVVLR